MTVFDPTDLDVTDTTTDAPTGQEHPSNASDDDAVRVALARIEKLHDRLSDANVQLVLLALPDSLRSPTIDELTIEARANLHTALAVVDVLRMLTRKRAAS